MSESQASGSAGPTDLDGRSPPPFPFARQIHGNSGPAAVEPQRRILLLAYHFPPDGSAGALRWEKMLDVLLEDGFVADVITLDPEQLSSSDATRLEHLSSSIRVFGVRDAALALEGPWRIRARVIRSVSRVLRGLRIEKRSRRSSPAPTPSGLGGSVSRWQALSKSGSLLDRWRGSLGARLQYRRFTGWAIRARRLGQWLSRQNSYDAVIASGPPHFVHPEAATLARKIGAAFVMDMRDPWSLVQRLPDSIGSATWWRIADHLESASVRRAALVLCNTERAASGLRCRYPDLSDRIVTIMNGIDDEVDPSVPRDERFVLEHAGTVYLDRTPEALFRAIGRLARRRGIGNLVTVRFHGALDGNVVEAVLSIARREGVEDFVEFGGVVPRADALAFLAASTVGVILPQDSHLAVPSKVFEYMNLPIWVVALAQEQSATADVLARTDAFVVDPLDVPHLERVLEALWDRWSAGERPGLGSFDPDLTRRSQALRFSRHLQRLLDGDDRLVDELTPVRAPTSPEGRNEDAQ